MKTHGNISLVFVIEDVEETTVSSIVKKFPGLEKLKLNGCWKLKKSAIKILAERGFGRKLKVLGLQSIPEILFKNKKEVENHFEPFTKLVHLEVDSLYT